MKSSGTQMAAEYKGIKPTSKLSELSKTEMAAHLKAAAEKDRQMVRGKFIFHEIPGGQLDFSFRKYKQDALQNFSLKDGEIYTIPLGVAKHLNTNCAYPSYTYKNDENGRPVVQVAEKIRRCSFQSLEFLDLKEESVA